MTITISTRNRNSQGQIFLGEISVHKRSLLPLDMAKGRHPDTPEIFLGDWLEEFEIGASEAAKIAGVTQGYISNIVAGRKPNINVLILLKLSDRMGVTVNDFYRPLPNKSQLNALKELSPKAQAAILDRQRKKA